MKPFTWFTAVAGAVFLTILPLQSQAQRPARTTLQQLQGMKEANKKLIDQQAAAILKLEEMKKEASQLRILVRRT